MNSKFQIGLLALVIIYAIFYFNSKVRHRKLKAEDAQLKKERDELAVLNLVSIIGKLSDQMEKGKVG